MLFFGCGCSVSTFSELENKFDSEVKSVLVSPEVGLSYHSETLLAIILNSSSSKRFVNI